MRVVSFKAQNGDVKAGIGKFEKTGKSPVIHNDKRLLGLKTQWQPGRTGGRAAFFDDNSPNFKVASDLWSEAIMCLYYGQTLIMDYKDSSGFFIEAG
jgi:hypothetical protein